VVWSFNNLNINFKNVGQHVDDARTFRTGRVVSFIIQTPPLKAGLKASHRVFSINITRVVIGSAVVVRLTFFFFLFLSLFPLPKNRYVISFVFFIQFDAYSFNSYLNSFYFFLSWLIIFFNFISRCLVWFYLNFKFDSHSFIFCYLFLSLS
jgi:hypothetical protein